MLVRLHPWIALLLMLTATSCGGSRGNPKADGGAGAAGGASTAGTGGASSGGTGGMAAGGHGGVTGESGHGGAPPRGGAGGLAAAGRGGATGGSSGSGLGGGGAGGRGKGGTVGNVGGMPGGGGSAEPSLGPGAHVIFPPNCATAEASLVIRGIGSGVTSVSVNGQVAEASDASFSTWSKTVTLVPGVNDITVDSADSSGPRPQQHVRVQQFSSNAAIKRGAGTKISTTALWGFDINAAGTIAYVTDDMVDGIVAYDLGSGDGTIVSGQDAQIGKGYDPLLPIGALLLEQKGQVLMTNDTVLGSVSLSTGDRTVISGQETAAGQDSFTGPWPLFGAGPMFSGSLNHPVNDADNNRILLADAKAIVAVDLATGNRQIVSKAESALGMTADFANHRVFFGLGSAVMALDVTTQARTTISGTGKGQGPALNGPTEIAYDATRNLLYVADSDDASGCGRAFSACRIYKVDIATGNRTLLSGPEAGVGPAHGLVSGLSVRRGILFVLNSGFDKYNSPGNDPDNMLLAVDPTSGTRVVVVR